MCAEGWFWLIPIDETRTSIGFVVDVDADKRIGLPHDELLDWAIARAPQVARLCANAKRETPVSFLSDFSYKCRPYAGPGYFLAGDSGAFIDPVFSTGVCLGMMTAKLAAEANVSISHGKISVEGARRDYARKVRKSSLRSSFRPCWRCSGQASVPGEYFVNTTPAAGGRRCQSCHVLDRRDLNQAPAARQGRYELRSPPGFKSTAQ